MKTLLVAVHSLGSDYRPSTLNCHICVRSQCHSSLLKEESTGCHMALSGGLFQGTQHHRHWDTARGMK